MTATDRLWEPVTVGALAIATPDLVERVETGAPPNEPDRSTFYGGDGRGYADYPTLAQTIAAADRAA